MEQIKYYKTRSGEFMEKIKIKLKKEKEIVIKFNGEKINIIPHIDLENTLSLYTYCKNIVINDEDLSYNDLVLLDMVYAIGVVKLCTNLDVENEDVDTIISSGITEIVKQNVKNYKEVYDLIKLSIKQNEYLKFINLITNSLPSVKEQTQDLKEAGKIIEEMVKNSSLDKVINGELEKQILESPTSLIKPSVAKKKTKSKK